ncbi:hypothetical protein [Ruegeria marina]|uniref:Uncharacterized protein n=1 Tax=Ruegeria marina TaxID=639004 RepID=A0A1G6ICR8_9RHOB|nr:hypothetical protein [Ruegeria marina]SDC03546.1 hypothetical protein SAMN04488239_10171 [Ruegeria marina]
MVQRKAQPIRQPMIGREIGGIDGVVRFVLREFLPLGDVGY